MAIATMLSSLAETLLDGGILVAFLASKNAFEGAATSTEVTDVIKRFEDFLNNREQLALALLTVAVVPPLVEEAAKGLGVRLLISPRSSRPRPSCWGWWQGPLSAPSRPFSTGSAALVTPTPTGGP